MAVNHDYYCECGEELLDIVADVKPKCVQCNAEMQIHYGRIVGMAQFNPHNPSMYGKYHPGFGEVCESYSHKQQLLKKYKGYAPRNKRGSGDTEFISDMKDLKQLEKKHGFE